MLVALQTEKREKGGFWRPGWRRGSGPGSSRFVQVCGSRFLLIDAKEDRHGGLNWGEIRRIACGESGRMLLPRELTPPSGAGIRPFRGGALQRDLMQVTAVYLLRTARPPSRRLRAAVYDPAGHMPVLAAALLPYAEIRVVTDSPRAYALQEQMAMEAYGASLPVSADRAALDGAELVVAPDGIGERRVRTRGFVLSGRQENRAGVVGGYIPEVPRDCLQYRPAGCDAWDFLAALYELSGARILTAKPPMLLRINGRNMPLRDAVWKLAGLDIGITV